MNSCSLLPMYSHFYGRIRICLGAGGDRSVVQNALGLIAGEGGPVGDLWGYRLLRWGWRGRRVCLGEGAGGEEECVTVCWGVLRVA